MATMILHLNRELLLAQPWDPAGTSLLPESFILRVALCSLPKQWPDQKARRSLWLPPLQTRQARLKCASARGQVGWLQVCCPLPRDEWPPLAMSPYLGDSAEESHVWVLLSTEDHTFGISFQMRCYLRTLMKRSGSRPCSWRLV